MTISVANSALSVVGTVYQANVNSMASLTVIVEDNANSSTLTFETSTDNSTWTAMSTGVYTSSSGVLVSLGGSTTTSKGRFLVDLTGVAYFRCRVSTFVSGTFIARVEDAGSPIQRIVDLLDVGLVSQGTSQATAFPISAVYNQFATVAASSAAILPVGVPKNSEVAVKNGGANALAVYPPVGGKINGGTTNAAYSLAASSSNRFISDGAGNFWSF